MYCKAIQRQLKGREVVVPQLVTLLRQPLLVKSCGYMQVGLVLEKSPAQAAGVEAGDIVLEVNGVDASGKTKE